MQENQAFGTNSMSMSSSRGGSTLSSGRKKKKTWLWRPIMYANPTVLYAKLKEFLDTSFMLAPLCGIAFSVMLAAIVLSVDSWMTDRKISVPSIVATTSTASQNILITTASATISFASAAFSISMLLFQLSSQQYSPRIVNTLFRDPYNKKVMGMVIGDLSFALICLQCVSKPNVDPHVTTWVAVVYGVGTVVAVVFFIDHVAKTLDISRLLRRVSAQSIKGIREQWENAAPNEDGVDNLAKNMKIKYDHMKVKHVVRFRRRGWIQKIDHKTLAKLVPRGGFLKVHTIEGRYALPGTAAVSVSMEVEHESGKDEEARAQQIFGDDDEIVSFDRHVLEAFGIGATRSIRYDPAFGLRQIVDVSCKALSPAINDPTTAQDAIFHAASVVIEFLHRRPPDIVIVPKEKGGGQLILEQQMTHDAIVRLAYNEVRSCASEHASVCTYLLESLALIRDSLRAAGHDKVAPEIERQARLVVKGFDKSGEIQADKDMVRAFQLRKFPDHQIEAQEGNRQERNTKVEAGPQQ